MNKNIFNLLIIQNYTQNQKKNRIKSLIALYIYFNHIFLQYISKLEI